MFVERNFGTEIPASFEKQQLHAYAEVSPVVYSQFPQDSNEEALGTIRTELNVVSKLSATTLSTNTDSNRAPHSFKEMFEPNWGDNVLQRFAKWYMKPRGNPETTIKVMEALQVHQFQKIPKAISRLLTRAAGERYQSTYTIKNSRLASIIDHGANGSVFNEAFHIGMLGIDVPIAAKAVATGTELDLAVLGAIAVGNIYGILAQRYSRARCERVVDNSLARGRTLDEYEYKNRLNLRLPDTTHDR